MTHLIAVAGLTAIALVLIAVLLVLQIPVPDQLYLVVTGGLGALTMAARPLAPPAGDDK